MMEALDILNSFLATWLTSKADFPVISASFAVGDILRGSVLHGPSGIKISMEVDVTVDTFMVQNVIAETESKNDNHVIVVGAHLDSVRRGPGINDNGSGSSTISRNCAELPKTLTNPK